MRCTVCGYVLDLKAKRNAYKENVCEGDKSVASEAINARNFLPSYANEAQAHRARAALYPDGNWPKQWRLPGDEE